MLHIPLPRYRCLHRLGECAADIDVRGYSADRSPLDMLTCLHDRMYPRTLVTTP